MHRGATGTNVLVVIGGVVVLALLGGYLFRQDLDLWWNLRHNYPGYVQWKKTGGPWEDRFEGALLIDWDRDSGNVGLSADQIRAKYPFLTERDDYPDRSGEQSMLRSIRKDHPEARVFWVPLPAADGPWPVCLIVYAGYAHWEVLKG